MGEARSSQGVSPNPPAAIPCLSVTSQALLSPQKLTFWGQALEPHGSVTHPRDSCGPRA